MPEQTRDDPIADPTTGGTASQQCGRCRKVFEMEPTSTPGTIADMWLCASCAVALLGRPAPVTHNPA